MKVTTRDALAAFRQSLKAATVAALEAILDDLYEMQGDPTVNQFKLQVLLRLYHEEVNCRLKQATEEMAATHWAAFEIKH